MEEIIIPENVRGFTVKEIGDEAFSWSPQLKKVTSRMTEPCSLPENVFGEVDRSNFTLTIPEEKLSDYLGQGWTDFGDYIGLTSGKSLLAKNTVTWNHQILNVNIEGDYYRWDSEKGVLSLFADQAPRLVILNWSGYKCDIIIDGEVVAENIDGWYQYFLPASAKDRNIHVKAKAVSYMFTSNMMDYIYYYQDEIPSWWSRNSYRTASSTDDVKIGIDLTQIPDGYTYQISIEGVDVTDAVQNDTYTIAADANRETCNVDVKAIRTELTFNDKYMTFSSDEAFEFADGDEVKAWIVSGYREGSIILTRVNVVPANTGVLLEAAVGTNYQLKRTTKDAYYGNLLKPVTYKKNVESEYMMDYNGQSQLFYNMILGKKDGVIGFYRMEKSGNIASGKAYLSISSFVFVDANANNIKALTMIFEENGVITEIVEPETEVKQDGLYYNLNGQVVENPTSGIYIVNGKKVYVK